MRRTSWRLVRSNAIELASVVEPGDQVLVFFRRHDQMHARMRQKLANIPDNPTAVGQTMIELQTRIIMRHPTGVQYVRSATSSPRPFDHEGPARTFAIEAIHLAPILVIGEAGKYFGCCFGFWTVTGGHRNYEGGKKQQERFKSSHQHTRLVPQKLGLLVC